MKMDKYVATKQIRILDVGEFKKGTVWEGYKDTKDGWKLKIEGTDKYYYFPEKSIKHSFKKI